MALRAVALSIALAGCAPDPRPPDLDALYAGGAEAMAARHPVVTIPGLLGSRLVDRDSGLTVWGGRKGLSADPEDPAQARVIAMPFAGPEDGLFHLRDGVRTDGVVRNANPSLLGINLEFDIYSGLIRTLIAGGYDFRPTRAEEINGRRINLDAFEFPYDWRRDIPVAAADLHAFLRRKARQVKAERLRVLGEPGPPVTFDIVAHSMGALVARYYLMFGGEDLPADGSTPRVTWAGAQYVRSATLIAPPFSGSIEALRSLVEGRSFGFLQPFYPQALVGTFPTMYQLMPRDRHDRVRAATGQPLGGLFDVETWARERWGLLDPAQAPTLRVLMPDAPDDAARRAAARTHLAKALTRAEQLQRALDQPNVPPPGLDLFLVVGGGFETPAGLEWDRAARAMRIDRFAEGDGVVLRASVLADERQGVAPEDWPPQSLWTPHAYRSILLLPREHVRLTRDPVFGDNLLFWLLQEQRARDRLRRAGAPNLDPRQLLPGSMAGAAARDDASGVDPARQTFDE